MEILKEIKIKLLNNDANVPVKATEHSSGYDIFSSVEHNLKKGSYELISTGIIIELEKGMEAQIRPRSGLSIKHGITVLNSPGTIDADYRGEVCIILINLSEENFVIQDGERICQMVIAKHEKAEWIRVDILDETDRGTGGF